jgi:hypothetical protein
MALAISFIISLSRFIFHYKSIKEYNFSAKHTYGTDRYPFWWVSSCERSTKGTSIVPKIDRFLSEFLPL